MSSFLQETCLVLVDHSFVESINPLSASPSDVISSFMLSIQRCIYLLQFKMSMQRTTCIVNNIGLYSV